MELRESLLAVSAAEGVPFMMPTAEQIERAGKPELVAAVAAAGGVKQAAERAGVSFLLPRAAGGKLKFPRLIASLDPATRKKLSMLPPGQAQKAAGADLVELSETMSARVEAMRETNEYQTRKRCLDLGKDLFREAVTKVSEPPAKRSCFALPAKMAVEKKEEEPAPPVEVEIPEPAPGVVAVSGSSSFEPDKKGSKAIPGLHALMRPTVRCVAASCSSYHALIICDDAVYAIGRNEAGQLGLNVSEPVLEPTRVLQGQYIAGACGKAHSVVVAANGGVLAAGERNAAATPGRFLAVSKLAKVRQVAAGVDFSLALAEDGGVWAWGYSQHGVLGQGTDGEHNISDGQVKLKYRTEAPARVSIPACGGVACGARHCAAVARTGDVYTWGCADYGGLGHGTQAPEWRPRLVKDVQARQIACGNQLTVACEDAGVKVWGKVPQGSDSWMTPRDQLELKGEAVTASCGHQSVHTLGDKAMSWGICGTGELGLAGRGGRARPGPVAPVVAASARQVACGRGFTLWLLAADAKMPDYKKEDYAVTEQ